MAARQDSRFERLKIKFATLLQHEGGVSAVEFSLFAPLLIIGLLMMVDVGLMAYQRVTMEHILRAAAQSAMADASVTNVRKVLETTAAENYTLGSETPTSSKPLLTFSVERFCTCPGNLGVKVACSTICESSLATLAFYSLSASRTYSGMIIPEIGLRPEIQVQVR